MAIPEGVLADILKDGRSKLDLGGLEFSVGHLEIALFILATTGKVEIVNAGPVSLLRLAAELANSHAS